MYPTPLSYSPFHNVKPDTAYSFCLLVCEDEDLWCPPWHRRKFCTQMQSATTSSAPILLRVWPGAGHDAPVAGSSDQVAAWLGFLMMQVGLAPTV
jgi:prolyl oligopeptidase